MSTIKRKLIVAAAIAPLFFVFGTASASVKPNAGTTATPMVKEMNQPTLIDLKSDATVLARGQNNLPKTKASQDKSCG